MKESEAWREIARRIAEGEWLQWGLCKEVHVIERDGIIDSPTKYEMWARIEANQDVDEESCCMGFVFPAGEADVRALAALFLALEAEDEGR